MLSFNIAGRILGVLLIFAFPIAGIFEISKAFGLGLYCIFMGPVTGLVELPALCSCSAACRWVARYLKYIAGWWFLRCIIYIGLSAGGYAIYSLAKNNQDFILLIPLIAQTVAGAFYLAAAIRREPNPAALLLAKEQAATGAAAAATTTEKSNPFSMFGGKKKEAVGGSASSGAAAKPTMSMGKKLFGGGDSTPSASDEESGYRPPNFSTPAPAPAPAAAAPKKKASEGMFSGGGLFDTSYKSGYSGGEANPFA